MLVTVPLELPRYAASPRQVARAGDLWRLAQEVAVHASNRAGWPPERYIEAGTAFVVYAMVGRHHQQVRYGQGLTGRTWLRDVRRGMLSRREVRIEGANGDALFAATQHWVHVGADLKPRRGSPALVEAFPVDEIDDPEVVLDPLPAEPAEASPELHRFELEVWHTWMDPLGHVNHPAYLDFCDEAVSRIVARAERDPQMLMPVAERIAWKGGALAGDRITVETTVSHRERAVARFEHRILGRNGSLLADATTLRRLEGHDDTRWAHLPDA